MLLKCDSVQELCDDFYEADSLIAMFESVAALTIIEYLRRAGFPPFI